MKLTKLLFYAMCAVVLLQATSSHSQLHEKHAEAVAASSEVHPVPGGQKFTLSFPAEKVFAAVVRYLNASERYTVESANRDAGLIATIMEIKGGWKQTGTRAVITIIGDSDSATTVRVAVTEQKRYKGLQTEPWSDPKVDDKASGALAAEMQPALTAALATK